MVFTKEKLKFRGRRNRRYLGRRPGPIQRSDLILLGSDFHVLTYTSQLKQWSQLGTGNTASWTAQLVRQEGHTKGHAFIPSQWSKVLSLMSLSKYLHSNEDELSNLCGATKSLDINIRKPPPMERQPALGPRSPEFIL